MIPLVFHQIWVGKDVPPIKKKWLDKNRKKLEKEGWTVHLWNNDMLTEENFPKTWKYIQKAKRLKKPFAMITDLMRYEIVYNHGGVYMDVNLELQKKRLKEMIQRAQKQNKDLIVAHEDKDVKPLHARIETKPGVVR